ncbi:MAG: acyl carrier protein [Bacteroidota bacterium]
MRSVTKVELIHFLKQKISEECEIPLEQIDEDAEFEHLNMDSVNAMMIMDALEDYLEMELNPLYFWNHPTVAKYAKFIVEELQTSSS